MSFQLAPLLAGTVGTTISGCPPRAVGFLMGFWKHGASRFFPPWEFFPVPPCPY